MPDIQSMIGKDVEIIANGMRYTGVLIEVSDIEVHLKGSFQWISLPMASVSEVKLRGSEAKTLEPFSDGGTGE
jgi:hypothetical protein